VKEAAQVAEAVKKALSESDEVIIEAFIKGTEVTNGIYKTKEKSVLLPITEVVTENDFFDYEAKYVQGKANEITPARISDDLTRRIHTLTSAIYDILGCKGIIRIDYIIQEGDIFLLEINTVPGMTETSFIPQQIVAQGLAIADVFTDIIEDAFIRK
jgi:D-alanine-D-alanine ligase